MKLDDGDHKSRPSTNKVAKSEQPLVSVLMSVYNAEDVLAEALNSIFNQTYKNWELIICDDASTDRTPHILQDMLGRLDKNKYVLLRNDDNRRLAFSLNRCLERASGEFIARMDADDLSVAERFEVQVKYLLNNPSIDLVGTAMRRFNETGPGDTLYPATLTPNRWTLGKSSRTPFAHATIMARRTVFQVVGGYTVSPRTARAEDIDLWYKFYANGLEGRNLAEALYWVREDAAAIRRRTPKSRIDGAIIRMQGNRTLNYPAKFYIPALLEILKAVLPYSFFDWHRSRARRQSEK